MKKIEKILIIGLGMIGGSFAKSLKESLSKVQIFAFDKNKDSVLEAKNSKIIKDFAEIDKNIENFDLIVLASPLQTYAEIFKQITRFNVENSIIIDLGSVKNFIFDLIDAKKTPNFIACHPIAGKEKSGFENSEKDLFRGKKFIICKSEANSDENLKLVSEIAKKIGSNSEFMDSKEHDEIFALTSHLPQFLSFLTRDFQPNSLNKSAFLQKSFRLNFSNPEIWSEIFKLNEQNIEKYYVELFDNMINLIEILENDDFDNLLTQIAENDIKNGENIDISELNEKNICEKLLFRLIIVASYLQISDFEKSQKYASTGFNDFTLIMNMLKLPEDLLIKSFKRNKKAILELFNKISS